MPFYLKESNPFPQLAGLHSVLVVPCRFCPAASLAVREKRRLEDQGIKAAVFESRLPHQFVACMWTSKRRRDLATLATDFDGVVVLGCDAMVEAVRDSVSSTRCRVIQGMEIEGLMNVIPTLSFPLNLSLELKSVTSVDHFSMARRRSRLSGGQSFSGS